MAVGFDQIMELRANSLASQVTKPSKPNKGRAQAAIRRTQRSIDPQTKMRPTGQPTPESNLLKRLPPDIAALARKYARA